MSSHHKDRNGSTAKRYAYKVISSAHLKKHDPASVEKHLNELGNEGWDLVRIDMKDSGKGISFLGLMKRKLHGKNKHRT